MTLQQPLHNMTSFDKFREACFSCGLGAIEVLCTCWAIKDPNLPCNGLRHPPTIATFNPKTNEFKLQLKGYPHARSQQASRISRLHTLLFKEQEHDSGTTIGQNQAC